MTANVPSTCIRKTNTRISWKAAVCGAKMGPRLNYNSGKHVFIIQYRCNSLAAEARGFININMLSHKLSVLVEQNRDRMCLLIFFLQICVIIISCKIFRENHISAKIELFRSASSRCFARFHDFLGKQIQQCWKLGGSASLSLALGHLNMMIPFRVQRSWQKSRPEVSLKRSPFSLERNTEFSREYPSLEGCWRWLWVTLCLGILRERCGRKSHAMNSVRLMRPETYWKEIKAGDETKASIK